METLKALLTKRLKALLKLIFEDTLSEVIILLFGSFIFYLIEFLPFSDFIKNILHKIQDYFIIVMIIIIVGSTIINFIIFKVKEMTRKNEENNQ